MVNEHVKSSPRGEIIALLRSMGRKLLFCRSAVAATGPSIAGALAVVVLQAAWRISYYNTLSALVLCIVAAAEVACVVAVATLSGKVKFPPYAQWRLSVALFVTACTSAAAVIAYDLWRDVHSAHLLGLIPLCGLIGIAWRAVRGLSIKQAAGMIDSRFDLSQRLSTAVEVMQGPETSAIDEFIYRDALRALRRMRLSESGIFRPDRTVAGIVVLTTALSLAVAILPEPSRRREFISRLDEMSQRDLSELSDTLVLALRTNPEVSRQLKKVAELSRAGDRRRLAEELEKLKRAGVDVNKLLEDKEPGDDEIASGKTEGPSDGNLSDSGRTSKGLHDENANDRDGEFVSVYNPREYKDIQDVRTGSDDVKRPDKGQLSTTPMKSAWSRASKRSDELMRSGRIPARYRQLIRRYFRLQ